MIRAGPPPAATRRPATLEWLDRDRATDQYLDEFFGIKSDDPLLYHLILNTGKVSTNAAAQIIVTAVKQMEAQDAE